MGRDLLRAADPADGGGVVNDSEKAADMLADVLSDVRVLFGFDYAFDDDRMAADLLQRINDRKFVVVPVSAFYKWEEPK